MKEILRLVQKKQDINLYTCVAPLFSILQNEFLNCIDINLAGVAKRSQFLVAIKKVKDDFLNVFREGTGSIQDSIPSAHTKDDNHQRQKYGQLFLVKPSKKSRLYSHNFLMISDIHKLVCCSEKAGAKKVLITRYKARHVYESLYRQLIEAGILLLTKHINTYNSNNQWKIYLRF